MQIWYICMCAREMGIWDIILSYNISFNYIVFFWNLERH